MGEVNSSDRSSNTLAKRMRAMAATDPANAADLEKHASALEAAALGVLTNPPTVSNKTFIATWARARAAWCRITGEPLI